MYSHSWDLEDLVLIGRVNRQTVLFSATQTQDVRGSIIQPIQISPQFFRRQCLCRVIPHVEDFTNFTFGKKEERQRKLVYIGVDDSELKKVGGLSEGHLRFLQLAVPGFPLLQAQHYRHWGPLVPINLKQNWNWGSNLALSQPDMENYGDMSLTNMGAEDTYAIGHVKHQLYLPGVQVPATLEAGTPIHGLATVLLSVLTVVVSRRVEMRN
ncbi:hypothetical protein ZWY2020_059161 [Hordeum vulgare]|nr:hypothetical protein ZWY2020_059161 [Hordeum vulgare]